MHFHPCFEKNCERAWLQQQRCHSLDDIVLLQRAGTAESTVAYQGISRSHQVGFHHQMLP